MLASTVTAQPRWHTTRMTLLTRVAGRSATPGAIRAAAVLFVTALTAAAAQVSVVLPFTPVPLTLQPLAVLIGGAALGARLGLRSQLLYLAIGAAGLPVFAAAPLPQGIARLLGPTGGYLVSYPFAAFAAGWLAERGFDRRYWTSVVALAAGLGIIFLGGVSWLLLVSGPTVGAAGAIAAGILPFVLGDVLLIVVLAGALPALWHVLGQPSDAGFTRRV